MRIVLAPNSFKGSASATQVALWLAHGINRKDPSIEVVQAPIADGGAGALAALGARFFDKAGKELAPGGGSLINLARIETDDLFKRIKNIEFVAVSDVTNLLLGGAGSARVFAPQKGASAEEVTLLEAGLTNLVTITKSKLAESRGAGAAGGLGFMALEFLGATLVDGTTWMMQEINFARKIEGADLILTGEGRYDAQSANTKATANIARLAKERGIPIALVCGEITLAPNGFAASYQLKDQGEIDEVIRNPQVFLEALGERIAQESVDFITK